MASPARITSLSKLNDPRPGSAPTIQVVVPRPARDRAVSLARLCGLETSGAVFVGEVTGRAALSVVAIRGDRVEQRWLTDRPDVEVLRIRTESISSVALAKGSGSTRRAIVRAADQEFTFEFEVAQAQAFHIALTAILAFARSPVLTLRIAS